MYRMSPKEGKEERARANLNLDRGRDGDREEPEAPQTIKYEVIIEEKEKMGR